MSSRAKRRIMVVAVLLVVAASGVFGLRQFRKAQSARLAEERRAEGVAAFEAGDYDAALQPLSYAVSRNKDDVELLVMFAETRSRIPELNDKHLSEAVGLYNQAIRMDPGNHEALSKLLRLYEQMLMWGTSEAAETARAILKVDPDHATAHEALATYAFTMRDYDETLKQLRILQGLEPDAVDWYMREVYTHLARLDSADTSLDVETDIATPDAVLDLCEQWIAERESEGSFYFVKAFALMQMGRIDEARETAREAVDVGVQRPDVHQDLVMLLEQLGEETAADALVEQAKESFGDQPWVWEQAIRRPWLKRDVGAAVAQMAEAEARFGSLGPSLLKWKVLLELLEQRTDDARQTLALLEERTEDITDEEERDRLYAWAEALRAHLQLSQANFDEARQSFERAIARSEDDAVLWYILGDAYHGIGEFDLAADAYGSAWNIEPNWIAAGVAYGSTLLELGRPHDALTACIEMEGRKDFISPPVYLLYVRSWIGMCEAFGSVDEATRLTSRSLYNITSHLESVRRETGLETAPVIADLLVQLYSLEGNNDGIESILEEVRQLDTDAPTELLLIAARGAHLANSGDAREFVDIAVARDGRSYEIAEVEAWLALQQGDVEGGLAAIEAGREAAHSDQEYDAERWDRMRAMYLARAEHEDAIEAMRAILRTYPDSFDIPGMILAQRVTWSNQTLADEAIAAQEATLGGGRSTRLLLAKATRTMRFNREDDRAVAAALQMVSDALRMSPNSLAGLTLMADALLASKPPRIREAIEYIERALDRYPAMTNLYPKLIALYQEVDDTGSALEWLDRLSRRTDLSEEIRRNQLVLLERQNELDRAIDLLTRDGEPTTLTDRLALASLYLRTQEIEKAETEVDAALALDPENDTVVRFAAEFYASTDRVQMGLDLLNAAPAPDGPGSADARLGAFYRFAGMFDESIDALTRATEAAPNNASYLSELAFSQLRAGRLRDAVETARRGLAIDPDHADLRANFALASLDADEATRRKALAMLKELGDGQSALVRVLEVYDAVDPENPSTRDLAAARELVDNFPQFLPAWRLAVNLHVIGNQVGQAYDLAMRAVQQLPNDPAPARWATELALRLNRVTEALNAAETWRARSYRDTLAADVVIASLYLRLDNARNAAIHIRPHFSSLIANEGNDRTSAFIALQAYLNSGAEDEAMQAARPLILADPVWRDAWIRMSTTVKSTATAARMLEFFESLFNEPVDMMMVVSAWTQHGRRTGSAEHFERARMICERALAADPSLRMRGNLLLGSIAELQGDFDEAKKRYREVLAEDPRNAVAANNLAFILARDEATLEQAAELSRMAVERQPDAAPFLDTYAVILKRQGSFDEAERHARKAVQMDAGNPEMRLTLAEILEESGRRSDALAELNRGEQLLETAPQFDQTLRARMDALRERLISGEPGSSANGGGQ